VYLLYELLLILSALLLIPYCLAKGFSQGHVWRGIGERLGFYAAGRLVPLQGKRVFWIHAASVGETRAAIPLVRCLKKTFPGSVVVLSTMTFTGQAIAQEIPEVDVGLFCPFDLSWVVRRVLRQIQPVLLIIVETEIWPNFVRYASKRGLAVMLINGRISDHSFPRYRLVRPLLRPVLEQFDAFCMQTELDAERIRLLGAPPERVEVTRNLKFDMTAAVPDEAAVAVFKETFQLPCDCLIWVAGSTHSGEEEAVADVYRQMTEGGRNVVLVLVPRHPERCRAVGEMLTGHGIPFALRSLVAQRERSLQPGEVLLVDSMGEMLKFYAVADLVFVGGSLVPVGGHNILEASLLKKPVIFGHYMNNFKEIMRLLLEAQGGICIANRQELSAAAIRLLDDAELRRSMGEGGNALLQQNAGATAHTLSVVENILGR
jgi:3-deoxy-D-manno-octulosonic-acid transferase